eukprot:2943902-Prymnesium_polylepis.1
MRCARAKVESPSPLLSSVQGTCAPPLSPVPPGMCAPISVVQELPKAMPPERFFDACVDKINECPLDELPSIGKDLGAKRVPLFEKSFATCHKLLLEREVEVLDKTMRMTTEARKAPVGEGDFGYSSGQILSEELDKAKRVVKFFYGKRMWVLPPVARAADSTPFMAKLKDAKAMDRKLKMEQTSRYAVRPEPL